MKALGALGISLALGGGALAAVSPHPGPLDPHIQTVDYDAAQVISLKVAFGYAMTLEFAQDERIQNVAVGNSAVWQVTPNKAADHLFIKPMQGAVDTDMTVITDARSYIFELKASQNPDQTSPYLVRILYPVAAALAEPTQRAEKSTFSFSGSRTLKPSDMSDDGRSTFIVWGPKAPIPAVFILDGEGREALVNGAVREGRFVIDQVANDYIFRLGDQTARATRHVVKAKRR